MELTIGVQHVARNLTIEVEDADEALNQIEAAITAGQPVVKIKDTKGGYTLLPTATIGYVHADPQGTLPVGFGRA